MFTLALAHVLDALTPPPAPCFATAGTVRASHKAVAVEQKGSAASRLRMSHGPQCAADLSVTRPRVRFTSKPTGRRVTSQLPRPWGARTPR